MIPDRPIGVAGAGSIGCFVGGMLAAAGRRVALAGAAARDRGNRRQRAAADQFRGPRSDRSRRTS